MKQKFVKESFRLFRRLLVNFAKTNRPFLDQEIDSLIRAERILLICAKDHGVTLKKCNFKAYKEIAK